MSSLPRLKAGFVCHLNFGQTDNEQLDNTDRTFLHFKSSTCQRTLETKTLAAMNIGLFGGTFDPIHVGHLALARAARERCKLGRILFTPANVPPHKQAQPLSPFALRYAMTALATAQEKDFIPSLLEAPEDFDPDVVRTKKGKERELKPNYTMDTVRHLKHSFNKADRLFLLIGIDAFADIAQWYQAEELFRECIFLVASRPGYSLADVANALPASLRPRAEATRPFEKQAASGDLVLNGVTIHLLNEVYQPISSTSIRKAAAAGKSLRRFVEPSVAEYIKKMGLYKERFPQE
jgi:nicotinate-nucleotide adenylyltransferase